jgi:hypothetical protein
LLNATVFLSERTVIIANSNGVPWRSVFARLCELS